MVSPLHLSATSLRSGEPVLVYLDLNKWIELAHAKTGTDKGRPYEATLTTAKKLAIEGRVIFPLCFAHFMEVAKIGNDAQRRTLAHLMVTLSQGWFLASASSLLMGELRRAIASRFEKAVNGERPVALTRSMKTAIGDPKQIEAMGDFNEDLFRSLEVLEAFIATARVGPAFLTAWRSFADQHEAGRALRWDTSREIRKRVYCALVTMGIQDRLALALSEFNLSMDALEGLGPDGCVSLLENIPMLDIEINLHVERNEHRDRKIEPNDEIDLGFLSLAVPYCHMVITEKFWASLIHRHELDQKYETFVGNDVNEVLALEALVE